MSPRFPSHRERAASLNASLEAAAELVRCEAALLRAEVREGIGEARHGVVALVVGVVALHAAALAALAAAALGLSLVWPPWMAAAAVAGGALLVGVACVAVGRARLARIVPHRTLREARAVLDLVADRFPAREETP